MFLPGRCQVLWSAYILATLVIAFAYHAQAKFLKADLRWPIFRKTQGDLQSSLTDLLVFREPDSDPVFEKAMRVVDNLATQSTCHQAAAAQLLLTCKTVGVGMTREQGKHELLERAQSVYAVRVAVCETGEGRAAVPSACKPILEIPQRLDHEIDVVNSRILASCLEALIAEHYYWTSYSNNRQDANTLCQATTIESTRLEALQSYRKLAQLLPELRAALGSTQSQWLTFLRQQQEEIWHMSNLRQKNQDERQALHEAELSNFRDAVNMAKEGLHDVLKTLQLRMANTDEGVAQSREATVFSDFAKLRELLHKAIATTGEQQAEAAAAQMQEMNNVHELALATTKALKTLQAGGVVQDVNELLYRTRHGLDEIAATQSAQLASMENHLQLSGQLSAAQKANLALSGQIQHFSASLTSELDTASATAARVSSKLERVNQALTRFEAASAILTSLFAVITIPCQIVERLHLRLLGLFALPALLLSFWKPRKHSYILTAFYVFLESIISLIEEHHDKVVASYRHVIQHTRATILTFAFNISSTQLAVAALATVVVLCCFLLGAPPPRPQPRGVLPLKSIEGDEDLTIAERFYLENRVRNGKCLGLSRDRYRRAATVC
ncbi:uncharacterized protein PV07_10435 [Cladophialophora immunda]|uniref:Nuclear fusion protein KAR5 n=1 Tax=Cladophialophora immunda TaxID=569365 RepID=A0A0D2C2L6_9EURO|nr:uncharacterized protein PV07_10435 [Cladophialophora immunda]KIW24740.1 hypothetical protein PV07_10435 [Cladophialophora immunda]